MAMTNYSISKADFIEQFSEQEEEELYNPAGTVYICHGPPRCTRGNEVNGPCPWCYRLSVHDERSPEQVLKDMDRVN
jgi:hypothetical protein